MKKFIGAAMLAGAAVAATSGAANAEVAFSGNVALTTDYEFRGISQTNGNPAIQGGFDMTSGIFYAGTWASNVSFSDGPELDVYAGVTPSFGPITANFGVIYYAYPGAADDAAEFNFYEIRGGGSISPVDGLSLGFNAFYAPEFFGETSTGLYLEGSGSFAFSDTFSVSGAYGVQSIDDVDGPGTPGELEDDYATWNVGATVAAHGFSIDLRYMDTDIDPADDIGIFATGDESLYDAAVVLTLKRAL